MGALENKRKRERETWRINDKLEKLPPPSFGNWSGEEWAEATKRVEEMREKAESRGGEGEEEKEKGKGVGRVQNYDYLGHPRRFKENLYEIASQKKEDSEGEGGRRVD